MFIIIKKAFPISWLKYKKYDGETEILQIKSIFMQEENPSLCASLHQTMS